MEIVNERERIEDDKRLMERFGEGESFIYGFLRTGELKNEMLEEIVRYENRFYERIPMELGEKKRGLEEILLRHESVLNDE